MGSLYLLLKLVLLQLLETKSLIIDNAKNGNTLVRLKSLLPFILPRALLERKIHSEVELKGLMEFLSAESLARESNAFSFVLLGSTFGQVSISLLLTFLFFVVIQYVYIKNLLNQVEQVCQEYEANYSESTGDRAFSEGNSATSIEEKSTRPRINEVLDVVPISNIEFLLYILYSYLFFLFFITDMMGQLELWPLFPYRAVAALGLVLIYGMNGLDKKYGQKSVPNEIELSKIP